MPRHCVLSTTTLSLKNVNECIYPTPVKHSTHRFTALNEIYLFDFSTVVTFGSQRGVVSTQAPSSSSPPKTQANETLCPVYKPCVYLPIHYPSLYNLAALQKYTVLPIEGRGGANAETIAVVVDRINAVENFMTVNILRYYVVVSLMVR